MSVKAPDGRALDDLGAARSRRLDEVRAHPIVGAEAVAFRNRRRGDGAPDLAAGAGILVEQQRRQASLGCGRSGGEPRGPGPDDDDIIVIALGLRGHLPISRLPFWISICMPSATGTRQPWRLPTP